MQTKPSQTSQSLQNGAHQNAKVAIWWQRTGILGWWFNLTAPARPDDMSPLSVREYIRKAELTSLSILGVFAFLIMIVSNSLSDPSTGGAAILMTVVLITCAILNRKGFVRAAAYTIICFMMIALMSSIILADGGLSLIWFTTYDLLTVPIFLSSLITHRRTSLWTTAISISFLVLDQLYQPHTLITGMGAVHFDDIAYEIAQPGFGWWGTVNRNIALLLFAGFFSWLAAFSFEKALIWAEQAKKEASVAQSLAEYQEQTAQELALFLDELVEAFVAQANGQVKYVRARTQNESFYRETLLLNERLKRFERLRKQQSTWSASQIHQAVNALSIVIQQVVAGNMPVKALIPGHFNSGVEAVDELAGQIYQLFALRR